MAYLRLDKNSQWHCCWSGGDVPPAVYCRLSTKMKKAHSQLFVMWTDGKISEPLYHSFTYKELNHMGIGAIRRVFPDALEYGTVEKAIKQFMADMDEEYQVIKNREARDGRH